MLRQLWNNQSRKPARRTVTRRAGPLALESLEDRCVPTAYTWIGPSGGLWSNAANWSSAMPGTVPGVGSDVTYNSPNTSVDDLSIPSPGLNSLLVGTSAGLLNIKGSLQQGLGTFIFQEGGIVLVSGSLANGGGYNQFAGTMGVTGVLSNSDAYALYGGSILGPGKFLNGAPGQQAYLLISNPGSVTLGVNLANYGQITWSSGNITLQRTLANMRGGTIAIDTPATISGTNGYLVNNYGATIAVSSGGTATIDVLMGTPNVNYGLITVSSGTLDFAETAQFTNEGRIAATVNNSGSDLNFQGSFVQQANTQQLSYTPLLESFPGDMVSIEQGAVFNAGQLAVLGTAAFTSPTFYSVTVNSGATATIDGSFNTNSSVSDSGTVSITGGNMTLGVAGEFDISASGTLWAYPGSNQDYIYGDIYNSGTVNVYKGAQLVEGEPLYSQSTTGVTNLNGTPATSATTVLSVLGNVNIAGGTFNVSNATIDTQGPQGFIIGVGATLNFTAGPNTATFTNAVYNAGVTILGAMNFADGNNVTVNFNSGLTLGGGSSTAVVSLYLTDVINVTGTTTFEVAQFDFLNVPATPPPTPYENLTFGTVVGTPFVALPPAWFVVFLPGGVMEIG